MDARDAPRDAPRDRFGTAEFDEAGFELKVGGLAVDIERKPLELLQQLLRHVGEVVTREELFESVWAGRITVDNVLANAVAKLRKGLGEANAEWILTQPRVGYRFAGKLERVVVGRKPIASKLALEAGMPVPQREHFLLEEPLGTSRSSEVWLARHAKTGERRVYKFSPDGERLSSLKREATLSRVLRDSLGERQDLARVIDWNFETAPFFLECEYGGQNLLEWAESGDALAQLDAEARIALFLCIAGAVVAAHSVGVLHKDIKPANVLIQVQADGSLQVRLTDFGSARLLEPGRLQELGITQLGLTITQGLSGDSTSGTPLYLAPELIAGQAPTVQSDLYALGMILYQLAAGDLKRPMASGWEREVADEMLREDIARATDGNPAQRLATVAELVERLSHRDTRRAEGQRRADAEHRAVQAERALELSRARRPWLIGAVAVLLLGLVVSTAFYLRSERDRADAVAAQAAALEQAQRAEIQAKRAEAINRFINKDLLAASDPVKAGNPRDATILGAVSRALPKIERRFAGDPLTEASIRREIAQIYGNLTDFPAALEQVERSIRLLEAAVPANDRLLLLGRYHRVRLLTYLTRLDDATVELKRADEAAGEITQSDPEVGVWASFGHVSLLRFQQRFEEMLPYSEAVERFQLQFDPADTATLYKFRVDRAGTYQRVNRHADSEKLLRELISAHAGSPDLNPVDRATATLLLGQAADFQGRSAEAVPLIESAIETFSQVVDQEDYRVLSAKMVLAETNLRLGRFADSTTLNQAVYEGFRKRYGDDHQVTLIALGNCGINDYFGGRHARALDVLTRARDGLAAQFGPQGPPVQYVNFYIAESLLALGRGREAVSIVAGLDEAGLVTATPGDHWDLRLPALKARVLLTEGHFDEGRQQLATAIQQMEAAGIADWHVRAARVELARSR